MAFITVDATGHQDPRILHVDNIMDVKPTLSGCIIVLKTFTRDADGSLDNDRVFSLLSSSVVLAMLARVTSTAWYDAVKQ